MEPENANSLEVAIKNNKPIQLNNINTFVDGAAVTIVGNKTFDICKKKHLRLLKKILIYMQ